MAPYIMLHGKRVFIEEIHSVESRLFSACLGTSSDGEIVIKIKSRCLEKALEFCEKRAQFRNKYSSVASMAFIFDLKFLKDVKKSSLDLIDLIQAAGRLDIPNLVNLLFDDVFSILCKKTPGQLEKIFKVRYDAGYVCCTLINELLYYAPPCPTLSKKQQEGMKFDEELLELSPAEFTALTEIQKRYWVYAHLVIKWNTAMFIEIHEDAEDAAKDDEKEDDEEESKVSKDDDDVGGP